MKILLIEDDPVVGRQLQTALEQQNYNITSVNNGAEGLYLAKEYEYQLGIFDLGLPDLNGLEVIKQLRLAGKKFPIIILTARDQWHEKVMGLEVGADDYLAKPFHMEELLARVQALLRRSLGVTNEILERGPFILNLAKQEIILLNNQLDLTGYEYRVLEFFLLHIDKVISKARLMDHIYDDDEDRDANVIEVFIGRLRKKLLKVSDNSWIVTVRGRGYRLSLTNQLTGQKN